MRRRLLVLIVLLSITAGPAAPAASSGDEPSDPVLAAMVADELTGPGLATFGVAIRHLPSGRSAYVNPDAIMEPASLFKLAVLYEAYRQRRAGRLAMAEPLTVTDEQIEKTREFGESVLSPGQAVTVDDALELMITVSETAPALALLDRLGYAGLVPGLRELGLEHTIVDHDSTVTARDMLRYFEALARLEAVDAESSREMLLRLLRQRVNDRLPSRLPAGRMVAHKTGNLPGVMHDVGLIYTPAGPVAVALLAQDVVDEGEVRAGMARLARSLDAYARDGGFGAAVRPRPLWDPALDARVRPLVDGAPALDLLVADLGTGQAMIVGRDRAWPAAALERLAGALGRADRAAPPSLTELLVWLARDRSAAVFVAPAQGGEPLADGIAAGLPPAARLAYAAGADGEGGRLEAALVRVEGGTYLLAARHERASELDLPRVGASVHGYLEQCRWDRPRAEGECGAG